MTSGLRFNRQSLPPGAPRRHRGDAATGGSEKGGSIMVATHVDAEAVEARIKAAPDAEALRAIVTELGVVRGSQGKLYTAEELLEHIDAALRVPELANQVTRTLGLRDKVRQLLGLTPRAHEPPGDQSSATGRWPRA